MLPINKLKVSGLKQTRARYIVKPILIIRNKTILLSKSKDTTVFITLLTKLPDNN